MNINIIYNFIKSVGLKPKSISSRYCIDSSGFIKRVQSSFRVEELKATRTLGERVEFTKSGPGTSTVMPRTPVRPDWWIRTEFGV